MKAATRSREKLATHVMADPIGAAVVNAAQIMEEDYATFDEAKQRAWDIAYVYAGLRRDGATQKQAIRITRTVFNRYKR